MLEVPAVWAEDTLAHMPETEIRGGEATPGGEVPERATVIRDAVVAAGATLVPAVAHTDDMLRAVHGETLPRHLASIHDDWTDGGFPVEPAARNVVPSVFPTGAMLAGLPARVPAAT